MLYIFGKVIPTDKKIKYALTNLFGVNLTSSIKICRNIGINPSVSINSLKKNQIRTLIEYIDKNFLIEQDLKKKLKLGKKNLINMKHIKGLRRLKGLPVRGQRTHTNGKTAKKLKR